MKYMFQVCCLFISLLAASDSFAGSYKARGEVYYEVDQSGGKWSRTIYSNVVSGVPVTIEQGDKKVSMLFSIEPPPSKKYTLTISLLSNPDSVNEISVTHFTRTYQTTLVGGTNGPFEFEEEHNGVKFGGALALSFID